MELYLQFLINGLISGSIYALVASGFSIIYNANKFMHFAHGNVVVLGGYFFYTFTGVLQLPYFLAFLLSGLVTGVVGILMFDLIYNPLKNKRASNVILLLTSIGLLIIIQNIIQLIYGARVLSVDLGDFFSRRIQIAGAIITSIQIGTILVCIVLFFALYFFMSKSQLGRSMRAVANNNELAKIVGINETKIRRFSFFLGSFSAGIAGSLVILDQSISPARGVILIVKGFTGAVIGGIDFIPSSILGAYLLGIIENMSIIYLPSEYKITISFGLLFLFLVLRPQGLLGLNQGIKK